MLLAIDVGNTNITLGLYQNDELGSRWRLATDHYRMPDEYGLQILGLLEHAGCTIADFEGICTQARLDDSSSRLCQNNTCA